MTQQSEIPWSAFLAQALRCSTFGCSVLSCPTKELGVARSGYEPSLASGVRVCRVCGRHSHFTREAERDDPFPAQEEQEREYREYLEYVDREGLYAPALNRFGEE